MQISRRTGGEEDGSKGEGRQERGGEVGSDGREVDRRRGEGRGKERKGRDRTGGEDLFLTFSSANC
eukprot:377086-Hanusia_phi.AAC.1